MCVEFNRPFWIGKSEYISKHLPVRGHSLRPAWYLGAKEIVNNHTTSSYIDLLYYSMTILHTIVRQERQQMHTGM